MTKPTFLLIFLSVLILFCVSITVSAQTNNQFQDDEEPLPAPQNRLNVLQELNLSREQLGQIRTINREYQPQLRQSRQRMQAANQALDEAVYGGQSNDAEVQSRLREAQTAHSEWIKTRTASESEITKVLNPNQLTRFRELRLQNKRTNLRNRQLNNQAQPVPQRLNRLRRQMRNRRLLRRNNP